MCYILVYCIEDFACPQLLWLGDTAQYHLLFFLFFYFLFIYLFFVVFLIIFLYIFFFFFFL